MPAVVKVKLYVHGPATAAPLENVIPSSETTLWTPLGSGLSHVTVSPMRTVTVWGLKVLEGVSTATAVVAALAPAAASPAPSVKSAIQARCDMTCNPAAILA